MLRTVAILLLCLAQVSVQLTYPPALNGAEDEQAVITETVFQPPYAGFPPLKGNLNFSSHLLRRQCSSNGTNFCFGNSVDSCPNCGVCCTQGNNRICCNASAACCGGGCCRVGEVCSDGQCVSSVAVVTATTTVVTTVTHTITELASVEVRVADTSSVVAETTVTISNVDVATDVSYVTVTVRATPGAGVKAVRRDTTGPALGRDDTRSERLGPLVQLREESQPLHQGRQVAARAYGLKAPRQASTSTRTVTVTSTVDVTSTARSTVTVSTTSIALITTVRTRTSVLNAKQTVSITSTIMQTLRSPATETTTIVTTLPVSSPSGPSATATRSNAPLPSIPGDSSNSLPTPTIIGIGVGCGAGAILIIGVIFVVWRVRRKKRAANESYLAPYGDMTSPIPPQFMPSPPHHDADFSGYTRPPRTAAGKANRMSEQTTMLQVTQGQGGRARSSTTYSYGGSTARDSTTPIEIAGSNPPERFEVEGSVGYTGGHSRTTSDTSNYFGRPAQNF